MSVLPSRPLQCQGLMGLSLDDDLVVCAPDVSQAHVLNATAAQIWAQCDGTHTVEAIAQDLATAHAIEYVQALGDVQTFLAELHRAGLVTY